ncbi:MAG: DMT family transporter, partial [Solirubrobacterales bacterium]
AALTATGLHRSPAVKAALLGTAAGVLFGLHAALIKASVDQLDEGILEPLAHWQLYAVIVLAFVSMTVAQISLQAGVLPPAISTASIATPLVGVVLGVTLFQERLHEDALGLVLSLLALVVVFAGIAVLALRGEPPQRSAER